MRTIVAVVLSLALSGCNVFEPFHTPGESENVEDLLSDAQAAMNEGYYTKAMGIMDKAMSIAPNDPRVRYRHAVAAVKVHDVDMLDVLDILQPADKEFPVDAAGERVLLMTDAELDGMYAAFRIVSADLRPVLAEIVESGAELNGLRQTDDVMLSYGVSETILGMLRVLDNDDTEQEFSLDERLVITKTSDAYDIKVEDLLLTPAERDMIIDTAIERSWGHFVGGRRAFFRYHQFVTNDLVWTAPVPDPPAPFPDPPGENASGQMARFIDDGVMALYDEKEDR